MALVLFFAPLPSSTAGIKKIEAGRGWSNHTVPASGGQACSPIGPMKLPRRSCPRSSPRANHRLRLVAGSGDFSLAAASHRLDAWHCSSSVASMSAGGDVGSHPISTTLLRAVLLGVSPEPCLSSGYGLVCTKFHTLQDRMSPPGAHDSTLHATSGVGSRPTQFSSPALQTRPAGRV